MPKRTALTQEDRDAADRASRLVKAMAHPVRIEILEALKYQPASPVETYGTIGEPLQNVSYHFKVLYQLGCIEEVHKVPVRGSMKTIYRSVFEMLLDTPTWERLNPAVRMKISDAGLKSLIDRVSEATAARTFDSRGDRHLTGITQLVDEEAWKKMAGMLDEVLDAFYAAVDEAKDRSDEGAKFPMTLGLLAFESPDL